MKRFLVLMVLLLSSSATIARPIDTPNSKISFGRKNFGPVIPQLHEHGLLYSEDSFTQSFLSTNEEGEQELHPVSIGIQYAIERLGLTDESIIVSSSYTSDHTGVTHIYLQQVENGLEVFNGVANVNVDRMGRVISFGSSFYSKDGKWMDNTNMQSGSSLQAPILSPSKLVGSKDVRNYVDTPTKAVKALASFLNVIVGNITESPVTNSPSHHIVKAPELAAVDIPAKLKYIQTEDGELQLVWDLEVDMQDSWYNAHISTETGDVVSIVDWVSDVGYNVFPLGTNSPNDGDRVQVHDPSMSKASPLGWHSQNTKKFTKTLGNNAYVQENLDGGRNWENNHRPDGGKKLEFNFKMDLKKEPITYLDFAITNLFYWVNSMHDLLYLYGFDEKSGNFQEVNFEKGGRGKDAVIANAQDGSGMNNANFATPPDGYHGRMRMYVWDATKPKRDGDLESGIIIHEYCHGLSIRLTGGGKKSFCLSGGESGGMGEGWGDFIATILRVTANTTKYEDFEMGSYATGGRGIRKFKYSTSNSTNPSTYGYIVKPGYAGVHPKGEVWAEILFGVFWDLIDVYGFGPNWFDTPLYPDDGKTYMDFRTGQHIAKEKDENFEEEQENTVGTTSVGHKKGKKHPKHPKPKPKPRPPTKRRFPGNVLTLQLIIDGMKLQPCKPSFVDARDAILLADHQLTGGLNQCILWKAFSRRGLGKSARRGGHEAFDLPLACE